HLSPASFPTRRSSDLVLAVLVSLGVWLFSGIGGGGKKGHDVLTPPAITTGSPSKKRARNEGPPGIRLFGGPTVNVNFKAPPKAGDRKSTRLNSSHRTT